MRAAFRRVRESVQHVIDLDDPRALRKMLVGLVLALILFNLPTADGLTTRGQDALSLFAIVIYMWATEALPLPVTALGAGVGLVLLDIVDHPNDAWGPYAQDTIYFILGSLILADAITKTGADRALATRFLSKFGKTTDGFLLSIVIATTLPAMFISDHAVAAVMLTIVISILRATGLDKRRNIAAAYVLAIAMGANIAGLATPSGGARNAVVLGYLDELYGIRISYLDWAMRGMPIALALIPVVVLLLKFLFRVPHEPLEIQKVNLGSSKFTTAQKVSLMILGFTVLLWMTVGEEWGLGTIAILGVLIMFAFGILDWTDTRSRITWGVPLIYGGALTMGQALRDTGAASWLANMLLGVEGFSEPAFLLLGTILVTVVLTNFMSDGGTAAVVAPVTLALASLVGANIAEVGQATAIASAFSFVMVIGTPPNVIAYSSGFFTAKDLAKLGVPMTVFAVSITYIAARWLWPMLP